MKALLYSAPALVFTLLSLPSSSLSSLCLLLSSLTAFCSRHAAASSLSLLATIVPSSADAALPNAATACTFYSRAASLPLLLRHSCSCSVLSITRSWHLWPFSASAAASTV